MLKHKIISIVIGTLMLSGALVGVNTINNVNRVNDNTKVVNKVLLSAPTSINKRAVVVNTDNSPLVLYSKASSNSTITSYISVGEMLTIQSSGDNFYKVKVQETGAVGYISANNLQIITSGVSDPYSEVNKQGYIINVSSRVNLRANATMNSNILAKLSNNTKINVLGKQGEWYEVNCNGTVGYIYQEYIGLSNKTISNNTDNMPKTNNIVSSSENSSNKVTNKSVSKDKYEMGYIMVKSGKGEIELKSSPNKESKDLMLLHNLNQFELISQDNNWDKIKVNNIVGYIPAGNIVLGTVVDKPAVVISNKANVYNITQNGKVVDVLLKDNAVYVRFNKGKWSYMFIPGNSFQSISGYVLTKDLDIEYNSKAEL